MAHKTFISYKYSEARGLRNRIIEALGADATYYQGETSDSPDLTDLTTYSIKSHLKDMIRDTSVTIVVISPHMKQSQWVDWEIEYSLREYSTSGITSHTNGVVGVVSKSLGDYSWIRSTHMHIGGYDSTSYDRSYLYDIINNNMFNQIPKKYICEQCKTVDALNGSYISLVTEDDFLADPDQYIENAYQKSQRLWNYNISKTR